MRHSPARGSSGSPQPPGSPGSPGPSGGGRGGARTGRDRGGGSARPSSRTAKVLVATGLVLIMAIGTALTGDSSVRAAACRTASANDAWAAGESTALIIRQTLVDLNLPTPATSSVQHGPGHDAHSASGPMFLFPADGSIATVGTMQVTADSVVASDRIRADQVSSASVADVSLLNGMVRAQLAKAQGRATATDQMADVSGTGSALVSVTINGVAYTASYPNLKVPLPSQFGAGSYVMLYERKDVGTFPDASHPNYVMDDTIRMIHVWVRDSNTLVAGDQNLEIVVAQTRSHAEAPTAFCGGLQWVGANAVVARVEPSGPSSAVVLGDVRIPDTGGESSQGAATLAVTDNGDVVRGDASSSKASGRIYPGSWDVSYAMAEVANLCIGPASGGCDITAQAVRAESNSVADWHKADSWGGAKITHLVVAGVNVCQALGLQDVCTPPPNTRLVIGPYTVYLNERTYDGRASSCLGHTGQTSTAVRIVGPAVGQVVVAKAYSTATYC